MQASVIVPARDERDGLARSLASLAAQTQAPTRILVVDLGSADGTQDWLRVRWPAVELVRLPRPDTPAASWLDAVLTQIDSEAIAFLMPGDLWPREALAALTAELEARTDSAAVMLASERLLRRLDRPPRSAQPAPCDPLPLSTLACRTKRLRVPARGAATLVAELLARLDQAPCLLPHGPVVRLASAESARAPLTPAAWGGMLSEAYAGLPAGPDAILLGLDAAGRPAGLLDLLGHTVAAAATGRMAEAFTLAELEWRQLEEAAPGTALIVTSTGSFGPADAAVQLCFEDLLRRAGKRPVRLALRRLTPSSLVLAGRLIEAAGNHPDFELWVADRVSRSYAASILRRPVRLLPPGMAGLGSILHGLGSRQMGLAAALPISADLPFEARWRSLDSWHEGSDRETAGRLGHVLARLAGAAPLLRTAALQEAWALILPGWAALAAGEDPLVTEALDTALFAALSGRACRLRAIAPGAEAFIATWAHVLEPLGLGFEPPVQEAA